MASTRQLGDDVFAQLNDLFHEEDNEEAKEDRYCYHDAGFLRKLLKKERELLSKVVQENIDLLEASEIQKDESFTIQQAQWTEIQEKKAQIDELETKVEEREKEVEQLRVDSAIRLFDECQLLKIKNQELQERTEKRIEELEEILTGVQDFRDRQIEVEKRMLDAEDYAAKTKAEMEKIIPDLERNFIEKCAVHEKDFERKLEELKLLLSEEVEDRVTERTKNILEDNEQLLEDLKIHKEATSGLAKQRDNLQTETSNLATEIGLLKDTGDLQIKRGIAQGRVVEQHQAKLLMLERSLRQVIRQYSAERNELESAHQQLIGNLTAEKQVLRNLVSSKVKELKRLRQMAQHMISQRTEVEKFLIESLEHIKAQLAASHTVSGRDRADDENQSSSNGSSTTLPSVRSTSHSWPGARTSHMRPTRSFKGFQSHTKCKHQHHRDFVIQICESLDQNAKPGALTGNFNGEVSKLVPKVDISDLSWSDREKVLRYLFKKIISTRLSNGRTERDWKRRPNPSGRGFTAPYTISEAGRLLT